MPLTTIIVVSVREFPWRRLLFWLHEFFNCVFLLLLHLLLELESSSLRLKLFYPLRWNLLCRGPFEQDLLARCCWKTLNSNSLDCFCALTVSVTVKPVRTTTSIRWPLVEDEQYWVRASKFSFNLYGIRRQPVQRDQRTIFFVSQMKKKKHSKYLWAHYFR